METPAAVIGEAVKKLKEAEGQIDIDRVRLEQITRSNRNYRVTLSYPKKNTIFDRDEKELTIVQ